MNKEQLDWEVECLERGKERYFEQQDALKRKTDGTLTDAFQQVLLDRIKVIAESMREYANRSEERVNGKYKKFLRMVADDNTNYEKVAYITLKILFGELQKGKPTRVGAFVAKVGRVLEVELKCLVFEHLHPAYFNTIMKSFSEQGVKSAKHKQKVLMTKFKDFEDLQWNDWTVDTHAKVGALALKDIIVHLDDLVYLKKIMVNRKPNWILDTTVAFDEWVAAFENTSGILRPLHLPTKCEPKQWEVDSFYGGYYHPKLAIPLIKTKGKDARKFVQEHIPEQHITALNKLQATQWRVNKKVLQVQKIVFAKDLQIGIPQREPLTMLDFPEHLRDVEKGDLTEDNKEEIKSWKVVRKSQNKAEQERKGKVISFCQSYNLATELEDWEFFHFVYNADSRGRLYCATSGLSPQGADFAKGLLEFARPVRLGASGVKWLAIHGANTFGEDKITHDARVKWVKDHEPLIRAIVEDPLSNQQWADADKPYQFLAFCFEWSACNYGRDISALGHLPVGLDGSCNGLQHFSAMLRDEVGGKSTNLLDGEIPEDIYGDVAKVTTQLLELEDHPYATKWLQVGITRKCAKRPVMTLPYGATQQSARDYILEYVVDNWTAFNLSDEHRWELAKYLTPFLWKAISQVVIAAREAMSWLQKNVGDGYCQWITPIGFPVLQHYRRDNAKVVLTKLHGNMRLQVVDLDKGVPYKAGQRNGIAPNFVHSIDSTHLVMTVNNTDFQDYAMIHDDFGTHAGRTEEMFHAIRDSFIELYENHDPLEEWAVQRNIDVETLPEKGGYRIEDIKYARYFFS